MSGTYRGADSTRAAARAVAVTPSDGAVIPTTRALYVGTSGNINVRMAEDDLFITFANVPVGIFPIQVTMVLSTSTTASNIVALY